MELLQLKYFYESAQNGSFSKTANKYNVPLTAVSSSIRRLEQELECKLFDRHCNCISLNSKGKELQKSLCIVFSELDLAINNISSPTVFRREIRILVRAMRRKITELITKFNSIMPNCSFIVSFEFSEFDFENYDIIIDEENALYNEHAKFEIYTSKLRIKCSRNHPMLGKKIFMKQLIDSSFISMGEKSNLHKILLNLCLQSGFSPKINILCNDIECYEKLIADGIGIAIGVETNNNPGIHYLDVCDLDERYTVYCYYKHSTYTDAVKQFVDFISTYISDI
ncbi:MAG: LysR family transcriptional regulator [Clostridia bacterium]|nr:LysR family transcriptional regulator [Clostridia bacterium]